LHWKGKVFRISALKKRGTLQLSGALMDELEAIRARELETPELREQEHQQQLIMQQEARQRIAHLAEMRRKARDTGDEDDDDFDDVDTEYAPY
ncbi:MAG: GTPase ObgE, partial [Pseudomonadales bacterium]|nr:GTPase ObgE [Pseudomonadales bacterium]